MRVVELTSGIAGAYAGKLLRDLGAQVVKVGPSPERRLFEFLDEGKAIVPSPPNLQAGDVVLAPATNAPAHPEGTVITISPYGRGGPWSDRPATEFTVAAWAGAAYGRGVPEQPPVSVGVELGEYSTGVFAAVLALAYRGQPVELDVSMLECTIAISGHTALTQQLAGQPLPARRNIEIPSIEPTLDGYVGFALVTGQQLRDFWVLIDRPDLIDHPDYLSMPQRWAKRDEVTEAVRAFTTRHTTAEIVEQAALFRIPCVPIGNGATLPVTDHFVETGAYVTSPDESFLQPQPPFKFARPVSLATSSRPTGSASAKRPLAGLRVVAFTAFWAGPWAAQLLRTLGADVVTIESIQRPDGIRFQSPKPPTADHWWEYGSTFHAVNAGKRAITLDLDRDEGRSIALRLIERADLVIENYSARVMDNFGFTYERLHEVNPSLVMVRMPAFGLDGPWRDRTAFAMTIEQASGLAWLTGHPEGTPLVPRGACDPLAGMHATLAALAALDHRRRTGEGQMAEVSMIGAAINIGAEQVIDHSSTGVLPTRQGNRGHHALLQNYYRCRDVEPGDPRRDPDRYLALAIETDAQLAALAAVVGAGDDMTVAAWCRDRDLDEALDALWSVGVPVARVEPGVELFGNPQLRARGYFEPHEHPIAGPLDYPSVPVRVMHEGHVDTSAWFAAAAPTLGQHTREVLRELGFDEAELDRLDNDGIIGTLPRHLGKPV